MQTHLTFGTEFTQAVEAKQVAQQEAERARYLVEKVGSLFILLHLYMYLYLEVIGHTQRKVPSTFEFIALVWCICTYQ